MIVKISQAQTHRRHRKLLTKINSKCAVSQNDYEIFRGMGEGVSELLRNVMRKEGG